MEILSRELLNEILKEIDIDITYSIEPYTNWLHIVNNTFDRDSIHHLIYSINIHELAYMCKKWAFDMGYFIETKALSSKLRSKKSGSPILDECFNTNWDNGKPYDPICDIKVCEWIIENVVKD